MIALGAALARIGEPPGVVLALIGLLLLLDLAGAFDDTLMRVPVALRRARRRSSTRRR